MTRLKGFNQALALVLAGGLTAFAAVGQEASKRRTHPKENTANTANRSTTNYSDEQKQSREQPAYGINQPRTEHSVADAIRWERYKERVAAAQARKEARSGASRSERQ